MGNRLEELPDEIGNMPILRVLLVANNALKALPAGLINLQQLEWLFAYDNLITELPSGLLKCCRGLDRALLEGNPLSFTALQGLFDDAPRSRVRTLGLDTKQI